MIKNSSLLNSPIDYSKFINFVSIVAKGTREEKLQLLYTFFDKSADSKITKEDLKAHISGTIISMQTVSFELTDIDKIKQQVAQAPESEIEQALDMLVAEIFMTYSGNQEELSYEEWKRWFTSMEGVAEVLAPPTRKIDSKDNSMISKMDRTAGQDDFSADRKNL